MARGMRGIGLALMLSAGLTAGACSPVYRNHGYVPPDSELEEVVVGETTRTEVAQAVGRPTNVGVLDVGGWYYVQSRFRKYGYRPAEEIDREVVAISFDESGVVRNVERFGLEEGNVVAISRRVTDDNTAGISFLRQLFGNLGNFDPGRIFGEG